jgi:endonuclease YncB( thermonuclease family)
LPAGPSMADHYMNDLFCECLGEEAFQFNLYEPPAPQPAAHVVKPAARAVEPAAKPAGKAPKKRSSKPAKEPSGRKNKAAEAKPSQEIQALAPEERTALLLAEKKKDFDFDGIRCHVKVVDYYDGDTVRVAFYHRGEMVQYRIRMAGYDSPEMHPKKSPDRSEEDRQAEMRAARKARAALMLKTPGLMLAEFGEFEKYGRILATLRDEEGASINEWMLANGYGVPYEGGKKCPYAEGENGSQPA